MDEGSAPRYVLSRDDLCRWHHGFDAEPVLTRHSIDGTKPWIDSPALTHCICFSAAAKAVRPLLELLAEALDTCVEQGMPDDLQARIADELGRGAR